MSRAVDKLSIARVLESSGSICRYCGQPVELVDAVITNSYWQGLPFICHRACKNEGVKQEALDCQVIDSDCNDCKHFKRGELIHRESWESGRRVKVNTHVFTGHCLKLDKPTVARPMIWTGMPCFEHRRS